MIITYLAPCYFLFSATEVLSSMMRGVGNAIKPTIITLFGACVLRLILLFTMTFPHLSNLTIALCYPITWTAASVMFLLYYKFGKWLHLPAKAAGHRLTDRKSSADLICGGFLCYGFGTVRLSFAVQFTPSPVFSNLSV